MREGHNAAVIGGRSPSRAEVHAQDLSDEHVSGLLRALAEQAEVYAIILMDPTGHIMWWSAGAERIFGLAPEEVAGKHSSLIFTPDDVERGIADLEFAMARNDARAVDDRWHVRADGFKFWSSGALVPLRNSNGDLIGFGKVLRDRTQLKEQLEHLREEARVARETEGRQKVGIATLAHELRNALSVFTHGFKMLQAEGTSTARRAELFTLLEKQTSLVHRLTEDLLDIARIETGKLTLELERLDLQDAIEQAVGNVQARADRKRISLTVLMPSSSVAIEADAARLQQVLVNLLDNAIKYTPENGRIWIKMTLEDPEAVVYVEDTGIGIPPDMLTKIFELFTQVQSDSARHGLGIGLSLVKSIVTLHGGSVQARSEGEGKGSEFTVRLPLLG